MKGLLFKRKLRFIKYIIASFMFNIEHLLGIGVFGLVLWAIESKDMENFKIVVILSIAYALYSGLSFYISRMLRIGYMRDTILDVRKEAYDKIIGMTYRDFSKKSKDVYISNLINDINNFEERFFVSLLNLLIDATSVIIYFIIILIIDIRLAGIIFVSCIVLSLIGHLFTKKTEKLQQKVSTENEKFTVDISNTFNGIEILKLNRIDDKFLNKSLSAMKRVLNKKFALNVYSDMQREVIFVLAYIIMIISMVYMTSQVAIGVSFTLAGILIQLSSSLSFSLVQVFPMYNVTKASASLYVKIAKKEINDELSNNINSELEKTSNLFQFNDAITVKNVTFKYDDREILSNASFKIKKGKKYLIKGVSGAGKSTLMKLLSLTYDTYEGNIYVDNINLREIDEKSFNSKVAHIYQDVFLFEDSILSNITLYKDVSKEAVDFAITAAGLREVVNTYGLNNVLKENGKNLSGGQRQRISIARAIAKDSEILFIDEGTSSLNENLGMEIEKTFLSLDRTVLSISHRFYEGVTNKYDYVLEIKNGLVNTFPASEYFGEVVSW